MAVIEDNANGVITAGFDMGDGNVHFAVLQHFLAFTVAANFGRR